MLCEANKALKIRVSSFLVFMQSNMFGDWFIISRSLWWFSTWQAVGGKQWGGSATAVGSQHSCCSLRAAAASTTGRRLLPIHRLWTYSSDWVIPTTLLLPASIYATRKRVLIVRSIDCLQVPSRSNGDRSSSSSSSWSKLHARVACMNEEHTFPCLEW